MGNKVTIAKLGEFILRRYNERTDLVEEETTHVYLKNAMEKLQKEIAYIRDREGWGNVKVFEIEMEGIVKVFYDEIAEGTQVRCYFKITQEITHKLVL